MAHFARPATWTYDQPLFRTATDDSDQLEAMLAAIALADEELWVVESDQKPVAFAWTRIDGDLVRFVRLYALPETEWTELLGTLLARIETQYAPHRKRLVLAVQAAHPRAAESLLAHGFRCNGGSWIRPLTVR
jgi:hypothetical protein